MPDARWEQIKAIFRAALAVDDAERRRLLDRECAGDDELRREVESLLAANAPGPLATGAALNALDARDSGISTVATAPLIERPGQKIGPYKLLQQIGEGGFGVVFMAEQDVPVRRRVALKVIKLGMDTRQVVARFEQERQALALMDHPHIAKVLDAGATPIAEGGGGRPFFVMEYVIGDPITAFADAHKLTIRDRLGLFAQVCAAVQHAHTKGVIHRDLKPRNVLVSMVDGRPHAKVIDFGIAKATGARLTDKTLFTEHRQLIGTPEYMSPEQAEGSPDIDTRTDVYALGVLLYELLTGATPFDARRLRSAAFGEMQRIIKEEEPPMPSVRLMKELATERRSDEATEGDSVRPVSNRSSSDSVGPVSNRSSPTPSSPSSLRRSVAPSLIAQAIRGELDWIVMKALEKDRARRYESPNQLAADVQRHLNGEPVVAAPPSMGYRVRKFVRKHRGAVVTASMVGAALTLGIATTTWQWTIALRANQTLASHNQAAIAALEDVFNEAEDPNRLWHGNGPESLETKVWVSRKGHELLSYSWRRERPGEPWKLDPCYVNKSGERTPMGQLEVIKRLRQFGISAIKQSEARADELEAKNARIAAEAQLLMDAALSNIDPLETAPLEPPFESVIRLYSAAFGASHPKVAYARFWAAYSCDDDGRLDEMENQFRKYVLTGDLQYAANMSHFLCVSIAASGQYRRSLRISTEFDGALLNTCSGTGLLAAFASSHHQRLLCSPHFGAPNDLADSQWNIDEITAILDTHRNTELRYLLALAYLRLGDLVSAWSVAEQADSWEDNWSGLATGPLKEIVTALIFIQRGEIDAARSELECARKLLAGLSDTAACEYAGVFDLFAEAESALR